MMPPVIEGDERNESMYPHHQEENKGHQQRSSPIVEAARRYKWFIAGGLGILIIIIVISVSVSGGGGGGSSSESPQAPATGGGTNIGTPGTGTGTTVSGPQDPFTRKKADLQGRIKSSFTVLGVPESHHTMLDSPESPQARALNWVAASELYDTYDDDQRLQRYALASFFYATYAVRNAYVTQQVPWTTAEKWLSEEHECDWEGITCDSGNKVVTQIKLEEHRISGTVPLDLVLLRESLTSLMLTNNLIFMEGDALLVFGYLENLETLMLADNYIVNRDGLPQSFRNLVNLKKLILSYNLLQGQMHPNYFENLHKLSHLEVESNYLSGPLPQSMYDMEQLVYLYVRRNDLNFNFAHTIKTANWPNIFSMWFDHNNITGTFPTEIGKMPGLASFSLTNTTVRGTIPTEIGLLTGLRRVWLYGNHLHGSIPAELGNLPILEVAEFYGNKLEGEMPQGTCQAIASATYDYKVLSADCGAVQCQNCCTQCY